MLVSSSYRILLGLASGNETDGIVDWTEREAVLDLVLMLVVNTWSFLFAGYEMMELVLFDLSRSM